MTSSTPDACGRTPQEKIDAIHRPRWCMTSIEGRLYWHLICAAIRDDTETLRAHLKNDPDCARLQFWYRPPIRFAVREGNLAATQGDSERVKLLLDAGADPSVAGAPWATPLAWAERRGHSEIAEMIRQKQH